MNFKEEAVLDLIEKKFNKKVTLETPIVDFCEDSISTVEFLFEIEQKLNKKFSENDILCVEVVKDLVDCINK